MKDSSFSSSIWLLFVLHVSPCMWLGRPTASFSSNWVTHLWIEIERWQKTPASTNTPQPRLCQPFFTCKKIPEKYFFHLLERQHVLERNYKPVMITTSSSTFKLRFLNPPEVCMSVHVLQCWIQQETRGSHCGSKQCRSSLENNNLCWSCRHLTDVRCWQICAAALSSSRGDVKARGGSWSESPRLRSAGGRTAYYLHSAAHSACSTQ